MQDNRERDQFLTVFIGESDSWRSYLRMVYVCYLDLKMIDTFFQTFYQMVSVGLYPVSQGLREIFDKQFSLNPLRPNSDLSQTSHCNIKGLSVSEVMRIENIITQVKFY